MAWLSRLLALLHVSVILLYLGLVAYGLWFRSPDSGWVGVDLILLAAPWTLFARIAGMSAMWYAVPLGVAMNAYLLHRLGRILRS